MSKELEMLRSRPKPRIGTPRIACPCGAATEVQLQTSIREKGAGAKSLGSKTISLCAKCAIERQTAAVARV